MFPAHCTGVASLCVPVDWLSCLPAVSAAPPTPRCHLIVQTLLQQDGKSEFLAKFDPRSGLGSDPGPVFKPGL